MELESFGVDRLCDAILLNRTYFDHDANMKICLTNMVQIRGTCSGF